MNILAEVLRRVAEATTDMEIGRLAVGLDATVQMMVGTSSIDLEIAQGSARVTQTSGKADIVISADVDAWALVLQAPPPPTFHSFTALELANDRFAVTGQAIEMARCRPVLERIFERVVRTSELAGPEVKRDVTSIRGRYVRVVIDDEPHDVYVESAGSGVPVLFLHTAGADSRQFRSQLADVEMASGYELFAVDMPFHGKSMPPKSWDGGPYTLTKATYLAWCTAILKQVIGQPAIVVGGSMGAAMSMVLAAERPELVLGIVAVEPPFRSKGRRNPYQHHVGVHGALHNASYVRGLMSPQSPEADRRLASWIYSQGAPGVYTGDLAFYSDEFDGAVVGPQIICRATPVVLLCGTYDYSASPEDGRKLAETIPGAHLVVMDGLGHFPMCENADLFRPYLISALELLVNEGKRR